SHADVTLLRRTFPDVPIVSFADGLTDTYRWFQSQTSHAPSGTSRDRQRREPS
ncbi:MAG: hypothetical protein QOG52_2267, partial [Frankiaceae bacterium]|nr:hypothetical protein [Frankiaceae bacterium]